jgi:hypothetical protein
VAVHEFPLDSERWRWSEARPTPAEHLGRPCVRLGTTTGTPAGVELTDGVVELDLAVGPERGFHGVTWRVRDDENFESFFVRPHQRGNPDAVQYTPVFNGISSWQLYHGDGYWAPVAFPIGEWFRVRVSFAGARGEAYVGDLDEPALAFGGLKAPVTGGGVGFFVGGPPIHVARFAYGEGEAALRAPATVPEPMRAGVVRAWSVSDAFEEGALAGVLALEPGYLRERTWTHLESEASGLADLSRVNGIRDGRNTVFARTSFRSARAETKALELGFSDRAVVYLNGRALCRGDYTYRSRDYRFLGSIGYYDTVYLPLVAGENELVVAVAEDLGGWGVQARFPDASGLALD